MPRVWLYSVRRTDVDASDLPVWAQNSAIVFSTLAAAVAMRWNERRKAKKEPLGGTPDGSAQVVAATFMERQVVIDLSASVRNLDGTMREMLPILARNNELLHDHAMIERLRGRVRE